MNEPICWCEVADEELQDHHTDECDARQLIDEDQLTIFTEEGNPNGD